MNALAALLLLFSQTQQNPEPQRQVPAGGIEGLVLQAGSGDPIAKAQVTLTRVVTPPAAGVAPSTPPAPVASITPVNTDNSGKFTFTNLEPGQYRITAGRNGFVRENYGARIPNGPGTVVTVPAGQTLRDIMFRLTQTATVSGRIRDSSGEPARGLGVQLLKVAYAVTGQKSFQPAASVRTDDRGEYRLFWITPGRYYLAVTATSSNLLTLVTAEGILLGGVGLNEVSNSGLPTMYFPGTVDPLRATVVEVGAGRELAGIDMVLPQQSAYSIKGRVVEPITGQPPRNASVSLMNRDASIALAATAGRSTYNATNGTFEIRDVVPGRYWIRAQAAESTATATIPASAVGRPVAEALSTITGTRMAAQMPLDVAGDVDGIALTLSSGFAIPGILKVEGQPLPTTPAPRVGLRTTAPLALSSPLQPINADGTFTLLNVFPGEYRATVTPLTPDHYIKEARIDQNDVLNQAWVINGPTRGSLEIVVGSNAGQMEGVVLDKSSKPVSAIQAVLIPDEHRDRPELYKTANTDQDGRFTLRGIAPGSYKLFAWELIETNAYYDPEILRQYEQQGKVVRITEGSKIKTEVQLIPLK
jgi:protocatechuate 3,4-dioxygenase beta subunit